MRNLGKLAIAGGLMFAILQLVRPAIPVEPATAELQAPAEMKQIIQKDCYSCHSGERRLSWFDQIVPTYWLVRHDILTARHHLNFSTLGSKPFAQQKATLYEAVNMIQLGAMPLPNFVQLHPEARVTPEELAALKAYLSPWGAAPAVAPTPQAEASASLETVKPELNGFLFDPSFEGWKLISTTDRGDNHTFRFILGNGVAVKAAQTGAISPWPDGAELAKIAWQQVQGADGLIHPGGFIQVELMMKNAAQYKDTEGWGWGRWRGLNLKPYGKDAHFVEECTGCHQPLSGNDYVYTLPISMANARSVESLNRQAASLPASLPYQPLDWGAITLYVDPASKTTATLYGNDVAMRTVASRRRAPPASVTYPAGTVLALVTWAQREDPHWFGARIPDVPRSVEFVQVSDSSVRAYRRFEGPGLSENLKASDTATQRSQFMLGLTPAALP